MFNYSSVYSRFSVRLLLGICLGISIAGFRLIFFHKPHGETGPVAATSPEPMPQLNGGEATRYLEATGESESLKQAVTKARFGLQWHERSPFGGKGSGYLALSHDQDLNAWFDETSVTIRQTNKEAQTRVRLQLKALGYGEQLIPAPPIAKRSAEGNRIEYHRKNSEVIEWYENRPAGIEQGFTINRRPERENSIANEPLRLVISLNGDLHARVSDDSQRLQFVNAAGESLMSYSKLMAKDAESKTIPGHLETNASGDEIVLVIEDQDAKYPLVVDPITTNEEVRFFASHFEAGSAFGGAVAISGNLAVVGAWGEDVLGNPDTGRVYVFLRSGSTWTFDQGLSPLSAPLRCGWTVAVEGYFIVFGCPGTSTGNGRAYVAQRLAAQNYQLLSLDPLGDVVGDSFGWSMAISGDKVAVGVPNFDTPAQTNAGAAFVYELSSNFSVARNWILTAPQPQANAQFGYDVDISGSAFVIGQPLMDAGGLTDSGGAFVYRVDQFGAFREEGQLAPQDPGAIDHFGADVAISGDTIAVGSPLDDNNKGVDAGSVYVFVKGANDDWTQQQKLLASDGFANDQFSAFAIDIQDNTLVVGGYRNDIPDQPFNPNEDSGEAYVFTRSDATWSEQARFRAIDGSLGDLFGIAIAISGDSVIVGAQNDDAGGFADAGSASVYHLSCIGGPQRHVAYFANNIPVTENAPGVAICQGQVILLADPTGNAQEPEYQWRKNGVNIPGAVIASYQPSESGVYDFVVTTGCITQTSTPFTLTVSTGCGINPSSAHFSTSGGSGVVDIMACSGCRWDVNGIVSLPDNPTLTFATTAGQGSGTLNYTVHPNNGTARVIVANVAGKRLTISQDGFPNLRVTNTNDSGPGSLRSAINAANLTAEDDLITFDIPGTGPHTIELISALPRLNDSMSFVNDRPGDLPVIVRRQAGASNFRIFNVNLNQTVLIAGLTIQDGRGDAGGGILNGGALTVRNSTIRDNISSGIGGAILNDSGARLDLINCSIFGNSTTSASDGGAVYGLDNSILNIVNTSFNGNSTAGRGAIFIRFASLQIVNSTFNVNASAAGGGSIHNIAGAVTVGNTIFRRTGGENIVTDNNNGGSFTSLGHNLSDDAAGGDAGVGPGGLLNGQGDIRNTSPGLLNLGNNGGPTFTNALQNTSPAINAGDDSLLIPSSIFADQRGFARRVGSHVDIGAFESGAAAITTNLQLSAAAYNVSEGSNSATITVTRTGDTSGAAKVDYASTVGTYVPCNLSTGIAAQNCDYIISSGTLSFGPAEASKTFNVIVIDDAYVESDEVLNVNLSNPVGASLGNVIASTLTITDNDSIAATTNPVDNAQFFVREHYYDFLSRLPDQGGLDYWSSQITGCGDPACVNSRRSGVSAAYFVELEFQQTGYVVYRIYRAALGPSPSSPNRANISYQQFMPDRSQLVAGPQLPQSTLDFANRFVQRAEFLSKYRNNGTNSQFVNALFDTAGLTPFTAERQQAINAMNNGRTRAQVLLDVIEIPEFKTREYNSAFVLMQYFGYLRRDPDQGGYDFWLDVLNNRVPGNFLGMVCAFITSAEYQQRFSPVVTRGNNVCAQ
jgi:hypothetical protein